MPKRLKLLSLVAAATLAACQPVASDLAGPPTVSEVDLTRYAGKWHEIARLPNRFQKKCSANVTAEYSLRSDGRVDVVNRCETEDGSQMVAEGVARIVDEATNARLEVRFAPAFLSFLSAVWGDYWVLELAPDYSYAVIGEPSRRYLWVLSRTPKMESATYAAIRDRLSSYGYDPADVVLTKQDGG